MTETGKRKSAPTGGGATQHQSKKKKACVDEFPFFITTIFFTTWASERSDSAYHTDYIDPQPLTYIDPNIHMYLPT